MDFLLNIVIFVLWDCILLYLLVITGVYFTIRTRFVQLRFLKNVIPLLVKDLKNKKSAQTGISSFQALTVSLASRIGTGNLAGVALAISVGGPGSIFWMWIVILLVGGSNSFVESTLGQLYKRKKISSEGVKYFYGGTSCYIERALNKRNLSIVFAIMMIIFVFILNMVHSHTISHSVKHLFEPHLKDKVLNIMSFVLPLLAMWPLLGGALRIAKISGYLVPVMATFYILVSFSITLINFQHIPKMIALIVKEAFNFKTSIPGGLLGGVIVCGLKRSIFSSEAGSGTATHASSSAEVNHPVEQGILQVFSVLIDTLIICSTTAFLILQANISYTDYTGIEIAQVAMKEHLGAFGPLFISIVIFFFSYSSIIGNYFYAENSFHFLKSNQSALIFFRVLMVIFIYIGTLMKFTHVWAFADIIMGLLTIVNLIAITFLSKTSFLALKDYETKLKSKKPMSFKASDIGMEGKLDVWN